MKNENVKNLIEEFKKIGFSDDELTVFSDDLGSMFGYEEILKKINSILENKIENIAKIESLFEYYNPEKYSLEKSKSIIINSLNKLSEKYPKEKIPIYYTTICLPTDYYFPTDLWKRFVSNNSFNNSDCGHIDFLNALLELKKEKIISIKNFTLEYLSEKIIVFTVIIDYLKSMKANKLNVYTSKTKDNENERKRLLVMNGMGDFSCGEKTIPFDNKSSIYYLILWFLYNNKNESGFCFYEAIDNFLVEKGEKILKDKRNIRKRINNGLDSLYRHGKFPQKAPNGKKIITIVRGKGLRFYNPQI